MIHNLERRREHWDNPRNRAPRDEHDMNDSLPYPFLEWEVDFVGEDVLEIGPGRGRQYEKLHTLVKLYSICDISAKALWEPVFQGVPHENRFLLQDYDQDFGIKFDVVHFWYVLHHIPISEVCQFFGFVGRHTREGGIVLFNTPEKDNDLNWYNGDGIGTTRFTGVGDIVEPMESCGLELEEFVPIHQNSNGWVIKGVKT